MQQSSVWRGRRAAQGSLALFGVPTREHWWPSLLRPGGSPVAEGAEQCPGRNQPRLSETASEGRKEAPTRLAGLARDGRTRTQVLGGIGGGGWRVFSKSAAAKKRGRTAAYLRERAIREPFRFRRSALTAHSEFELQRSRSGHVQDRTQKSSAAVTAQRCQKPWTPRRRPSPRRPTTL